MFLLLRGVLDNGFSFEGRVTESERERERRKRGARERGRGAIFTGSFPKARSQEHVFHNKANNSPCFNY